MPTPLQPKARWVTDMWRPRAIAVLAVTCIVSTPAHAEVEIGSWEQADSINDTAAPLGEALANEVAKRLLQSSSKIIFLNVKNCEAPKGAEGSWCKNFTSELESRFIKAGLRFLAEGETSDVRKKIAEEQIYQQNSMQVDVSKAVELGKQKAFQAFVSVDVTADSSGTVTAHASSVDIKEGVVSVSEKTVMKVRSEAVRPWSVTLKSLGLMLLGGAGTALALVKADDAKKKGDAFFKEYNDAQNAGDATAARKKSEAQDGKVNTYYGVAAASACVAIYGYFKFDSFDNVENEYKIELSRRRDGGALFSMTIGW